MGAKIYTMEELVEMDANPSHAKTTAKPWYDLCRHHGVATNTAKGQRPKAQVIADILDAQGTPQPMAVIEKAVRKANREKKRAYHAKYYEANREKALARRAKYYEKNREKERAYYAKWRKENPDYHAKYREENPPTAPLKADSDYAQQLMHGVRLYKTDENGKTIHPLQLIGTTPDWYYGRPENTRIVDGILEVTCYRAKCREDDGGWHPMQLQTAKDRVHFVRHQKSADGRERDDCAYSYCSPRCKKLCEVFGKSQAQLEKDQELLNMHSRLCMDLKHGGWPKTQRPTLSEFVALGMPDITQLGVWRQAVLKLNQDKYELDGNHARCHACEQVFSIKRIECHHVVPKSQDGGQALDACNGVCLCKDCHKTTHSDKKDCPLSELNSACPTDSKALPN